MRSTLIIALLLVAVSVVVAAPPRQQPPIDDLAVIEIIEIDRPAGPGNTAAYLAPDGSRLAYLGSQGLCLLTLQGEEEWCGGAELTGRFDHETVRWSPDGRYLAFTENFFFYYYDSDIWLFDTTTLAFRNMTDDGQEDVGFGQDDWGGARVDVMPCWLDAERLGFLRYREANGTFMILDLASGEVEPETVLVQDDSVPIYALEVHDDVLFHNYDDYDETWALFRRGPDEVVKLAQYTESYYTPLLIDAAPDGQFLLTKDARHNLYATSFDPEHSSMRIIPSEGGSPMLIDEQRHVAAATWAPSGTGIAYLVRDSINTEQEGLYLSAGPGEPGRMVLAGRFFPTTPRWQHGLTWASNNMILLAREAGSSLVVVQLGVE